MIARIATLLRRRLVARKFGIRFRGINYTVFPTEVLLFNQQRKLCHPQGDNKSSYMSDVVNLWLDDEYGLGSISQPIRTVVDVGCNIGLFSLWARHHFPEAKIHAYEPNPVVFDCAMRNFEGTGIEIFPVAVGAKRTKVSLGEAVDTRCVRAAVNEAGQFEMIRFSDVERDIGGRIDLLKVDCEGGEWDLFSGECDLSRVCLIRMEYHLGPERDLDSFKLLIHARGFRIQALVENRDFGILWLINKSVGLDIEQ